MPAWASGWSSVTGLPYERLSADADEFDTLLHNEIGLHIADARTAWPRTLHGHAQVFGTPDAPP